MITMRSPTHPSQPHIQTPAGVLVEAFHDHRVLFAELTTTLSALHPNVLLIGSLDRTDSALQRIRPSLRTPVVVWTPEETPEPWTSPFSTLVIRGVDALNEKQQRRLLARLDESMGDVQVVSMASQHVYPLVARGVFLERLYYRLNAMLLDMLH